MDKIYYNALSIFLEGSYKKLEKALAQFGSWEKAWLKIDPQKQKVDKEKEFSRLEKRNIRMILREDEEYPKLLREIPQPPFGIYCIGNLPIKTLKTLAIVGTRKATMDGKKIAREFANKLASQNIAIVSGLAIGIDAAAHEGCLDAEGKTIAVLGNGLDYFYPRMNERLAKRIIEKDGVIISEYPIGTPPLPYRFLERNRIVSGISDGVLVIESPEISGSLATARHALDQNRDVFAIPGPISHPNFKGSNKLIRQGAELVTTPEDIMENYGIETIEEKRLESIKSDDERLIFEIIRKNSYPISIDKIVELTHLETSRITASITFLIVKDLINETDGGYKTNIK